MTKPCSEDKIWLLPAFDDHNLNGPFELIADVGPDKKLHLTGILQKLDEV